MIWRNVPVLFIMTATVCCTIVARAQTPGNEWIDYSQRYWKLPVVSDGLYTISFQQLINGGFPVTTINPQYIQIYGRGKQCRIKVSGEEDGTLDASDFIEFYAKKNDAWLDSLVYDDPDHVPNPNYSLFNDTAHYFITVGSELGLRTSIGTLNNFSDFTPRNYCEVISSQEFHGEYLIGKQDINGISLPTYDVAEGWFAPRFPKGGSHVTSLLSSGAYTGTDAPQAVVNCISASASLAIGFPNHHLQVGWGSPLQVVVDSAYYGHQLNHFTFQMAPSQLGATQTAITHRSIDDLNVATDFHAVSYVEMAYPHNFDFQNSASFYFSLDNPANENFAMIEVSAFNSSNPRLFITDENAFAEIQMFLQDGLWKAIVPLNGQEQRKLWMMNGNNVASLLSIAPVTQSGFFTDYVNNELQNAFVIITHPILWSAALNYGSWRNTNTSTSLVVNVEELYMQYAYGIWKNPLAIRRFCKDLLDSWSEPPAHMFIMGKSIHEANFSATIGARNDPEKYARNLVPTWGYPGSDVLFTAGLNGTLFQPAIPTGRLAAKNINEVLEYLNKVIEHESQLPDLWQKNILHFGGGTIDYEQNLFRGYLNAYKSIAADTSMGARVYSFFKNTSDPIQMNVSDSIQLLINQGVSMMTFFGHASSSGFDQNIDSPQSYSNQGKYPLLIGNSCYTGNIHLGEAQSASEQFVLVPDRGVIGFLAKSDLGVPVYLNLYTENFYREIFVNNYGKSIGYCMNKAVESFQVADDFYRANTAYTFALHGDPAVKLHPREKPDFSISATEIYFEPADITASQVSFQVNVIVENLGKATNDPVGIELIRHYPNGVDSAYVIIADRILNRDTIAFTVLNNVDIAAGDNRFDVLVDYPLNIVPELNDASNNVVLGKSLVITSGDLFPVVPYPFEVVSNSQPILKSSTGFAFESSRTYIVQADTTDAFNSPMLQTHFVTQSGGVIEWSLPFAMTDSMVVFWRASADSTSPVNPYHWHLSSFQYISNENGWGQQHFFQFREDQHSNLAYNEASRLWTFNPTLAHLKCEVYGSANTTFQALATRYQLNLNVLEYGGFGFDTPALMVAVLDSSTFIPWESNFNGLNPTHDFGNTLASANARNRAEKYFIFQQNDAGQLQGFVDMMNAIPDEQYVLVYTWQLAQKDYWNSLLPQVNNFFTDIGATNITAAPDSVPFILFMQKGHPNSLIEVVGNEASQYLVLETDLVGALGSGTITSPKIGPASDWGSAEWNVNSLDLTQGDSTRFRFHGINWLGADVVLSEFAQAPNMISDLGNFINPDEYPFVQIEAKVNDLTHYTAPQLKSWHVLYDEAPECALNPAIGFYINTDTLQQGEMLKVAVAIQNISPLDMDSLKVRFKIQDDARNLHSMDYPLQAPLLSGQNLLDTIEIDTRNYPGLNSLLIEVNPIDSVTGSPHQPEQFHFNNLAKIDFVVIADKINPLLDVTFDGLHILNGDIISSQPNILITLDDENRFFILNEDADTSHFKMFLRQPGGDYSPVYFSSAEVQWSLASAPANKFKIEFMPVFFTDGEYSLRVQASDKSGNVSGDFDNVTNFVIVTKPSITEVLNYPNPFSTRTQFVFTLTGTEPPDQFKIQIMNVSGDIVREITQDELGPMRIGRNLSSYWWDGTDEYGDRLANGVYLYRVVARLNGQPMEMNHTTASKYFTKGFGKMYLFR